jgi:hypothetical protein
VETGFDVMRRQRYVRFGLCALLVAICCSARDGTALRYSAKPIRATVVDAETGLPLEGVIVNAYWHMEDSGGHGLGPFNVTEAVTDANGVFYMAGWGPMEVPRLSNNPLLRPRLDPDQPWLQLFKRGYRFLRVQGDESTSYLSDPMWTGDSLRESAWNNKVIRLERFHGTDEQYLNHLHGKRSGMAIGACWWAKVPRMTAAFIREGEQLRRVKGWNDLVEFNEIQERYAGKYCGSPKELLGDLLK